jgi:hypothetical protein
VSFSIPTTVNLLLPNPVYFFSTATMFTRTLLDVTLYVPCLSYLHKYVYDMFRSGVAVVTACDAYADYPIVARSTPTPPMIHSVK